MAFGRKSMFPLLALCSWSTTAWAAEVGTTVAPATLQIRPIAIAKQEAIIGGASRLAAIAVQQGSIAAATPQPAVAWTGFDQPRRELAADKPDVFGSSALPVAHTPLDRQWQRASAARLGKDGLWSHLLSDLRGKDRRTQVEGVNHWVNQRLRFADDMLVYGTADRWATAQESLGVGRGDCEDFAIAKMQLLRTLGVPAKDLYLTIVRDLARREDHAILVVRLENQFVVLDNGADRIFGTGEIRDYRPVFSFTAAGSWLHGYERDVQFAALSGGPAGEGR
jgi:predicted transglutaminase-like cysteine proteinase